MTEAKHIETHDMCKYKGWDIKTLINNEKGTITYQAYFEKSPRGGVIYLNGKTPEELKKKIDGNKLKKGAY